VFGSVTSGTVAVHLNRRIRTLARADLAGVELYQTHARSAGIGQAATSMRRGHVAMVRKRRPRCGGYSIHHASNFKPGEELPGKINRDAEGRFASLIAEPSKLPIEFIQANTIDRRRRPKRATTPRGYLSQTHRHFFKQPLYYPESGALT
jgi:hypothetical protein